MDLVWLNRAPPPLADRVIRDGQRVLTVDEKARQVIKSVTVMRYLDFHPLREQALRASQAGLRGEQGWQPTRRSCATAALGSDAT